MYDVIIVGAGITGSYLAGRLRGLNVLLIEKDKNVTLKDSGIVSRNFLNFFDDSAIKAEIRRMDLISPSGKSFTINDREPFAFILKREEFGRKLRADARKHADVRYTSLISVEYFRDFVRAHTTGGDFDGKMIVGADGANSIVRRDAGIEAPMLSLGIMMHTTTKIDGNIEVYFDKRVSPDFFAWIIPQNNEYGLMSMSRPRERLNLFQKTHYLPKGKMTAHLIPTGYVRSYASRTILVGDSAGQNKPLTGGGIMFGLKSAYYAAAAIDQADGIYDNRHLARYEKMWKRDFAREIDVQFLARMFYRRLTNKQIDRIFEEIGPEIEKLSEFDYDKFSRSWIRMSKIKLARALITAIT